MSKILMVSPEVFPFAKAGGLGDVVASLSDVLSEMGHDVRILMPRYYTINTELLDMHPDPICIHLGTAGEFWVSLYYTQLDSGVRVYFLNHEELYGHDGIYGPDSASSFDNNFIRFALLSKACFTVCQSIDWYPNSIHSHDWATALVMLYLRFQRPQGFENTTGVFTIHNIGYQGIFPAYPQLDLAGIAWDFHTGGLECMGNINLMQSGIVCADHVTTVSPTYAGEIQGAELGEGLGHILQQYSYKLSGILNGVDYTQWNPQHDPYLSVHYTYDSIKDKRQIKKLLQDRMGLTVDNHIAVVGIVSRIVQQKGFEELCIPFFGALQRICSELHIQVVIVGNGEAWLEEQLGVLSYLYPNLSVYIGYDESLGHLAIAGADFLLVPSRYEPCGLTQLYAMAYGTVPIVSNTGGLRDTVMPWDEGQESGTGFHIGRPLTAAGIFYTIAHSMDIWYNHYEIYQKMQKNGMKMSFNWKNSAQQYQRLYK